MTRSRLAGHGRRYSSWALLIALSLLFLIFLQSARVARGAPAGLVAAYAFDEGSGTTVGDASGSGNSGTAGTATWTTSGEFGSALVFNGSGARVTVPDSASLDLTSAMTLEAWVYPTASGGWRDLIYKGTNDIYYLEGSSPGGPPAAGGTFSPSPLFGASPLPLNAWSHLAATYDGSTMRLFVNGAQAGSKAQTGSIATSTGALTIGGDALYGQYFQGRIDEVRIYTVALTQGQIQSDMTTPIGVQQPDPTPPTVSITSPALNAQVGDIVNVMADASDNVGVVGVQFLVDGVASGVEDSMRRTGSPGTRARSRTARTR